MNAVTLQHFVRFQGVFQRYKGLFGLRFGTDKEDERFFVCHAQIVVHPSDAVMQDFAFAYQIGGRLCDHADIGAPFVVLQRHIFLCHVCKFFGKFQIFVGLFYGFLFGILGDADIVLSLKVFGKQVLF